LKLRTVSLGTRISKKFSLIIGSYDALPGRMKHVSRAQDSRELSMRRPVQYTFTATDRRVYQQWLVSVCAFYGCIALMVLFVVLIRAYVGHAGDGTIAALQRRDAVNCPISITDGRPTCEPQTYRGER
jgi:hypothetical protein